MKTPVQILSSLMDECAVRRSALLKRMIMGKKSKVKVQVNRFTNFLRIFFTLTKKIPFYHNQEK